MTTAPSTSRYSVGSSQARRSRIRCRSSLRTIGFMPEDSSRRAPEGAAVALLQAAARIEAHHGAARGPEVAQHAGGRLRATGDLDGHAGAPALHPPPPPPGPPEPNPAR